jgi:Kef-type K+ transport system membrane component KefB
VSPFDVQFQLPFSEMAGVLVVAAVIGAIALLLRQPLIVAFIAVGIFVGPSGLGWMEGHERFALLAEVGIAVLLFVVGLKLDVQLVRSMGKVALATGLGQVFFTSAVGFGLSLALGMDVVTSVYVAVALTFSSTIIIVKLLSDKREIDSLHGRIAVGFLIVQDIVVVLVMIALTAFGQAEGEAAWATLGRVALQGVAMLAVLGALMRWVLPRLLERLARSQELLVLFAIAWAVLLAALGEELGFSREVGAFLGGISLASSSYREMIAARLVSVRDFLLLFFFIVLGHGLDLSLLGAQVVPAIALSLFVLVGNPLIVLAIMGAMGYRKRTGFLAGLTVAQISEFSLILGALGVSLGHLGPEAMGLITLVGLITIGLSTYLILYSHPLYERLAPFLSVFERAQPVKELGETPATAEKADVLVFGLGRFGGAIARALHQNGARVYGVDFDPQAVQAWRTEGLDAHYGDAEDPEFPGHLPLDEVRTVVSTMPQRDVNLVLVRSIREHGFKGRIALTAHNHDDAELLRRAGADLVLLPFVDAAGQAVRTILSEQDSLPSRSKAGGASPAGV